MRKVTRFTGYLIPPLGILLFLEAFLLRQDTFSDAVVTTAAGLLGMLPKGLVLLISISLAAGIIALSRKRVLVQELFSLETLAHVDTMCLDKTGTLTQGVMKVESVFLTDPGRSVPFDEMMGAFLRCTDDNNATFRALRDYFGTSDALSCTGKVPFSSDRKWSAVTFSDFTLVIGAPERLAAKEAETILQKEQVKGKRILAAGITRDKVSADRQLPPVQCLAIILIADPLRENAAGTLAYFWKEGVEVKLISGDNPVTASALAAHEAFCQVLF